MKERKNIASGYLRGTSVTPRLYLKQSAVLKALLLRYYLNLLHDCIVELMSYATGLTKPVLLNLILETK